VNKPASPQALPALLALPRALHRQWPAVGQGRLPVKPIAGLRADASQT
jgi:hypothetical protein